METEYAEFTSLESTYGSTAPSTLGCTVVEDTGMGTDGWKNCKGLDKKKKSLSALCVPSFCLSSCRLLLIRCSRMVHAALLEFLVDKKALDT